jgi:hypothetical protein
MTAGLLVATKTVLASGLTSGPSWPVGGNIFLMTDFTPSAGAQQPVSLGARTQRLANPSIAMPGDANVGGLAPLDAFQRVCGVQLGFDLCCA